MQTDIGSRSQARLPIFEGWLLSTFLASVSSIDLECRIACRCSDLFPLCTGSWRRQVSVEHRCGGRTGWRWCPVPGCSEALEGQSWKDARRGRFLAAVPRRRRQSVARLRLVEGA